MQHGKETELHEDSYTYNMGEEEGTSSNIEYYRKVSALDFPVEHSNSTCSRDSLLKQIQVRVSNILRQCNNCHDLTALQNVHSALGQVLVHTVEKPSTNINKRKCSNQNSETQRCFYSTRKKRKLSMKSLGKPTSNEIQSSQSKLNRAETEICALCFNQEDNLGMEYVNWIACSNCSMWVHSNCANVNATDEYTCSYCV
jgi:hypothetical protein